MKLKVDRAFADPSFMSGLAEIVDVGDAHQVEVSASMLKSLLKLLQTVMKELDVETVWLTVEKSHPLVVGGKRLGLALAIQEDREE